MWVLLGRTFNKADLAEKYVLFVLSPSPEYTCDDWSTAVTVNHEAIVKMKIVFRMAKQEDKRSLDL